MKQCRFYKYERVKKSSEFKRIYKEGKSYRDIYLIMYVRRAEYVNSKPAVKIGLTISKKVGNAIVRNRLKRLLREVYRINKNKLIKGIEIVFIARLNSGDLNYKEVKESVTELFKKAKIFNKGICKE